MKHDFFLALLLSGGSRNRTELEAETLPYTFYTPPRSLRNYRIYGNTVEGESVGDRTANLFANVWKKGYIRADNGREEQIDGFIYSGFFPVEYGQTYSISRNISVGYDNIRGYKDDKSFVGAGTDVCDVTNPFPNGEPKIGAFTVTNENVAFIRFNDSANDLGMKYMIVKGTYTEQTMPAYEPYGYRVPVTINEQTTNIYLDEQLTKSGEIADYIDYKTQKRYNYDGTIEDVTLPEIAIYDGANEISVDTTVQPSKVYLQGNISETEVLSRSLQSSPQMLNLQPLDRSEFQLNDFSEIPVEDLNELEQENTVDKMSIDELEQGNQVDKTPIKDLEIKAIGDDENAE